MFNAQGNPVLRKVSKCLVFMEDLKLYTSRESSVFVLRQGSNECDTVGFKQPLPPTVAGRYRAGEVQPLPPADTPRPQANREGHQPVHYAARGFVLDTDRARRYGDCARQPTLPASLSRASDAMPGAGAECCASFPPHCWLAPLRSRPAAAAGQWVASQEASLPAVGHCSDPGESGVATPSPADAPRWPPSGGRPAPERHRVLRQSAPGRAAPLADGSATWPVLAASWQEPVDSVRRARQAGPPDRLVAPGWSRRPARPQEPAPPRPAAVAILSTGSAGSRPHTALGPPAPHEPPHHSADVSPVEAFPPPHEPPVVPRRSCVPAAGRPADPGALAPADTGAVHARHPVGGSAQPPRWRPPRRSLCRHR